MATYEYKCDKCNEEFELVRSMNEDTTNGPCVHCGANGSRHFRTPHSLDTFFPGSFNWDHPVHGI